MIYVYVNYTNYLSLLRLKYKLGPREGTAAVHWRHDYFHGSWVAMKSQWIRAHSKRCCGRICLSAHHDVLFHHPYYTIAECILHDKWVKLGKVSCDDHYFILPRDSDGFSTMRDRMPHKVLTLAGDVVWVSKLMFESENLNKIFSLSLETVSSSRTHLIHRP